MDGRCCRTAPPCCATARASRARTAPGRYGVPGSRCAARMGAALASSHEYSICPRAPHVVRTRGAHCGARCCGPAPRTLALLPCGVETCLQTSFWHLSVWTITGGASSRGPMWRKGTVPGCNELVCSPPAPPTPRAYATQARTDAPATLTLPGASHAALILRTSTTLPSLPPPASPPQSPYPAKPVTPTLPAGPS